MTKKKAFIYIISLFMVSSAFAEFNFETCSGSGSFEQQIIAWDGDVSNDINVGSIPKGIKGLKVELQSSKDVDIRIFDTDNNQAIVAWSKSNSLNAPLWKSYEETKAYKDVNVTYSGYNGTNGNKGYEFIEVDGTTPVNLQMKAFGYKAGYATVNYSWSGKVGCIEGVGEGNFTQEIEYKKVSYVGKIIKDVSNIRINLKSDKDLDIQLYGEDGTAIAAWSKNNSLNALMYGAGKQEVDYHGMHIIWSGYNGVDGNRGDEYIQIIGTTTEELTMKVYGYQSGYADATYSWGSSPYIMPISRFGASSESIDIIDAESTCGATIDWQDVEMYDGTLGVTTNFVDEHQEAVGQLAIVNRDNTIALCSGTLLPDNNFLTAAHCIPSIVDAIQNGEAFVRFNYQKDSNGVLQEADNYMVTEVVENGRDNNNSLDYAIIKLSGTPSSNYTPAALAETISDNETLTIVQHPNGIPKVIEAGLFEGYLGTASAYIKYADLDTSGGSSGSGVLNSEGNLIAVHTNGGCDTNGVNYGVAIAKIKEVSPIVTELLNTKNHSSFYIKVQDMSNTVFFTETGHRQVHIAINERSHTPITNDVIIKINKHPNITISPDSNGDTNWEMSDDTDYVYFRWVGNGGLYPNNSHVYLVYEEEYTFDTNTDSRYAREVTLINIDDDDSDDNVDKYNIRHYKDANIQIPSYRPTAMLRGSIMTNKRRDFDIIVHIAENNDAYNLGEVAFTIDKSSRFSYTLDETIDINMTQVGHVKNSDWKIIEEPTQYKIIYIANRGSFSPNTSKNLILHGRILPLYVPWRLDGDITVQMVGTGGGGTASDYEGYRYYYLNY